MLPVVGEDEFFDSSVFPVFGLGRSPYKENGIYRVLKSTLPWEVYGQVFRSRISTRTSNMFTLHMQHCILDHKPYFEQ